jgi:hypothetical protein
VRREGRFHRLADRLGVGGFRDVGRLGGAFGFFEAGLLGFFEAGRGFGLDLGFAAAECPRRAADLAAARRLPAGVEVRLATV